MGVNSESVIGSRGTSGLVDKVAGVDCRGFSACGGWIVLFAGATKNSRARKVPMPAEVREAVEACCVGKQPEGHVFTWSNRKPILDFRAAWVKACKEAGVAGLRFHDLRRSATRNIIRKGVAATVAMRITGRLTRAVFDAYDVTADQDLLNAAERI